MIKKLLSVVATLIIVTTFQYCNKKDGTTAVITPTPVAPVLTLPSTAFNYSNVVFPAHISNNLVAVDNTPAGNPITNNGATLGRVLFYDKQLSKTNTVSCASCHNPSLDFNDTARLSVGFANGLTARNSMPLLNVRFYASGKMFWDERSNTLEDQVLQPIQNSTEMGLTLPELEAKVAAQSYYPALFQNAFGSTQVTSDRISKALSQFVRSIVTYQSKYDRVKQGIENFTPAEQQGENIFLNAARPLTCASCHTPPMFLTSSPAGPFALLDPNDRGINNQNRFKSGSLRNIATARNLFHNGSVPDVNAMLNSNIPAHGVPPQDRAAILAFLQTLTDNTVRTEQKFSNPFR
jgi:cytochrome c peroxidase